MFVQYSRILILRRFIYYFVISYTSYLLLLLIKVNAEKSAQSKALLEKLSKQVEDYGKPALAAHTDKANMTTGNKKGGDDKIAEKLKRGLL